MVVEVAVTQDLSRKTCQRRPRITRDVETLNNWKRSGHIVIEPARGRYQSVRKCFLQDSEEVVYTW